MSSPACLYSSEDVKGYRHRPELPSGSFWESLLGTVPAYLILLAPDSRIASDYSTKETVQKNRLGVQSQSEVARIKRETLRMLVPLMADEFKGR